MALHRRAFTLIELVMVGVIFALITMLLIPAMRQRWNADGLSNSLNNVRQILVACGQYRLDDACRVPARACRYSNGQITGGWDTWNFAGKNCQSYWASASGGVFDESAYSRFLNPYLQASLAPIPPGYINTGSGSTWTFNDGTPTEAQRQSFQVRVCRSPGDIATRQRAWPNATPGISCYNDVGTSYHLTMQWWSQPGGPSNFTSRYNAGMQAISGIGGIFGPRPPSDFVWIQDQMGAIVANSTGANFTGEFGEINRSVSGFLDGRSTYLAMTPGAMSGPGYTFGIAWP